MAITKLIISPLIFLIIYTTIANSESISQPPSSVPPPAPSPVYLSLAPTSPSYPATPASAAEPIAVPAPSPPPSPAASRAAPQPNPVCHGSQGIKAAYWPSFNGLVASTIDTSYFTHIYYAFLLIDPSTFKLNVTPFDQQTIPEFINTLRTKNPPVKTLLSIGGADQNQTKYFSIMSRTNQTRAAFINSTIEVARNYGFDGLDLDWESPANNQEMFNLALLFQEWRQAINLESSTSGNPSLLLSSAVYYSSRFTTYGEPRSYPIQAINNFLDWINPMCYDYHGSWDDFTGPNAALYDPNSNISTSYGIGSWIQSGVSPEKMVMGLPLYGRTWMLQDPNDNGIGAPALGVGPGDGILSYDQILDFNNENKAIVHFDGESVSYYSVSGGSWIGYDDTMSVHLKIRFARSRGLGGYFFWALGQDKNWTISKEASRSWDG